MSRIIVRPSSVSGKTRAMPSKSYTHRALTAALLSNGKSKVLNPLISLDTEATLGAVRQLGGEAKEIENGWSIEGTAGHLDPMVDEIDVGNSGTTIRFMTAVAALSESKIRLTGDESILKRPMGPLADSLGDLGAFAHCLGKGGTPPVEVGGGLRGGSTEITKKINFSFHDILEEKLPEKYDIISMQNVLLYYEEEGRKRILSNATQSMEEDGWLLCENVYWDSSQKWLWEYKNSMENLEEFGLIKQDMGKMQIYRKD